MIQVFIDILQYGGILGCLYLIATNAQRLASLCRSISRITDWFSTDDIAELRDMARRSREKRQYQQKAHEAVAARMAEK